MNNRNNFPSWSCRYEGLSVKTWKQNIIFVKMEPKLEKTLMNAKGMKLDKWTLPVQPKIKMDCENVNIMPFSKVKSNDFQLSRGTAGKI